MGLLDYFRKHRLLAAFRQEPGISTELCDRLSQVELPHLQDIAEACRRLKDREASSAQNSTATPARVDKKRTPLHLILLPAMLDRADTARELAQAAQGDIEAILDRLFTEVATGIVAPMLIVPGHTLPSHCCLNREALMSAAVERLSRGTSPLSISQALNTLIQDDPDHFITGYTDWAHEYSSTILADILPMLEKSAPRDCTPDQAWCQREIITLLKTQKNKSAVQQQFKSRVKIAPNSAYHGYYQATRACHDEAEQMWQRMKTTLVSANTDSETLAQSSQPSRPASGLTSQSKKPVANYLRTNSPDREIDIMTWLEQKELEAITHPLRIPKAARPDGKMFNERAILDEIASRLLTREDAAAIENEMLSLVIIEEKYAIDFNPYEHINMTDHHNHLQDYDTYKSNIPFNSGSSSSPI